MKREKNLVQNTVILAIGSYLPKLTTLITLPLLTQHLTKAEYGTYDLMATLVSLLLPAATLQIQSAAFRFLIACRDSKEKITVIISNIFAFTIPMSILGLSITYYLLQNIPADTKRWMMLYFFVDIIYIGIGQVSRGLGKNFSFAVAAILNSVVSMCGMCVALLWLNAGLNGIILSVITGGAAATVYMGFSTRIIQYFDSSKVSVHEIKKMLSYSWPMVPNALSNWVLSLSDRLVLLNFIGIEANAVYAVANKIPSLISAFRNNFTSAWQENASLSVDDDDRIQYYSNMVNQVNCIFVGMIACLIAFTPIMFSMLIRGDYDSAYPQIPILLLGVYFASMAQFMGGIYIAYMKTKSVGITTMLAALCNLAVDILLVRRIGIYAASISTLVSYLILFVYRLIDVQKFQPLKIGYAKMFTYSGCLIAMGGMVTQRIFWVDAVNCIFGISFAVVINRKLATMMLKAITRKVSSVFHLNKEK